MDAIRRLTPQEVPLLVALMAIRSVPALLRRRRCRSAVRCWTAFAAAAS